MRLEKVCGLLCGSCRPQTDGEIQRHASRHPEPRGKQGTLQTKLCAEAEESQTLLAGLQHLRSIGQKKRN